MTSRRATWVALIAITTLLFSIPASWAQTTQIHITAQIEPLGSGVVYGEGLYIEGASVLLQAKANPGFRFIGWMEGGILLETAGVLELIAEENRDLVARFESTLFLSGVSGLWIGKFDVLPSFTTGSSRLDVNLRLNIGGSPLTLGLSSGFTSSEWRSLSFRGRGGLLGISFSFGMVMDPAAAAYKSAHFGLVGAIGMLRWHLRVRHSLRGGIPPGPHLLYTLSMHLHTFSIVSTLEDGGGGLEFKNLLIRARSLPWIEEAFGIHAQGAISFTRSDGFAHAEIQLRNIMLPFSGGLALDARVKYTTTAKEFSLSPRWLGFGLIENITLYGDAIWGENNLSFEGFEFYGFKLRCCLACAACPGARISAPFVEIMVATVPARVPGGFRGEEFAYWKFGICGPACCGNYYTLETAVYFSPTGGLFGISRAVMMMDIPLSTGFSIQIEFQAGILGDVELELGWRLTF